MKKFQGARGVVNDLPKPEPEIESRKDEIVKSIKDSMRNFFRVLRQNVFKLAFDTLVVYWLMNYLKLEVSYLETMAALIIVRVAVPRTVLTKNNENVNHVNSNEQNKRGA